MQVSGDQISGLFLYIIFSILLRPLGLDWPDALLQSEQSAVSSLQNWSRHIFISAAARSACTLPPLVLHYILCRVQGGSISLQWNSPHLIRSGLI